MLTIESTQQLRINKRVRNMVKVTALVMAGGRGTRMATSEEKPLLMLCGQPIIEHVVAALRNAKRIDAVVVAVSDHAPRTASYVANLPVKIVKTPGQGFISDMAYVIKELKLRTVLTIGADLPLVTSSIIDKIIEAYSLYGKPSFVVAVPLKIKAALGLGTEYAFEVNGESVVPSGINIINGQKIDDRELDQAVYVVDWKEVAVNINTSRELKIAEELFNKHKCDCKKDFNQAILFDMDGVLVDVSLSYRRAIQETVKFFTGKQVEVTEIQELKEKGGYNNDWDLTEAILCKMGKRISKADIIKKFQEFYLGINNNGFIQNEKWLLSVDLLKHLHKKYALGIVTGRPRAEALFVLQKFNVENVFDVVVAMEDYPIEKAKPDPYPIQLALEKMGIRGAIYVGDSVDDVVASKDAKTRAIGCIPPKTPASPLKELLLKHGAEQVIDNINDIAKIV